MIENQFINLTSNDGGAVLFDNAGGYLAFISNQVIGCTGQNGGGVAKIGNGKNILSVSNL